MVERRHGRRALCILPVLVAVLGTQACLTINLPPDPVGSGPDASTGGLDGGVGDTPVFVGSRLVQSNGTPLPVGSIAGLASGDLVIAAWMASPGGSSFVPSLPGWDSLGVGTSNSGGAQNAYWMSSHVVRDGEDATATYSFPYVDGARMALALLAFRGARGVQPVGPALVEAVEATCDAGTVSLTPPLLAARERSAVVYAIGTWNETPGEVSGFVRVESTSGLGTYRLPSLVPAGGTAARPDFGSLFPSCFPVGTRFFAASLAVVGGP